MLLDIELDEWRREGVSSSRSHGIITDEVFKWAMGPCGESEGNRRWLLAQEITTSQNIYHQ